MHLKFLSQEYLKKKFQYAKAFETILTEISNFRDFDSMINGWFPGDKECALISCFRNKSFSNLIRKALNTKDTEKRKKIIRESEALFIKLQPGLLLYCKKVIDVIPKRFDFPKNMSLTPFGMYSSFHAALNRS
jgi:ABC-type transport system substrate-binding protein